MFCPENIDNKVLLFNWNKATRNGRPDVETIFLTHILSISKRLNSLPKVIATNNK